MVIPTAPIIQERLSFSFSTAFRPFGWLSSSSYCGSSSSPFNNSFRSSFLEEAGDSLMSSPGAKRFRFGRVISLKSAST